VSIYRNLLLQRTYPVAATSAVHWGNKVACNASNVGGWQVSESTELGGLKLAGHDAWEGPFAGDLAGDVDLGDHHLVGEPDAWMPGLAIAEGEGFYTPFGAPVVPDEYRRLMMLFSRTSGSVIRSQVSLFSPNKLFPPSIDLQLQF
jgi:hypothetical protein